jgi:hypothetical protein
MRSWFCIWSFAVAFLLPQELRVPFVLESHALAAGPPKSWKNVIEATSVQGMFNTPHEHTSHRRRKRIE